VNDLSKGLIEGKQGNEPLINYPWKTLANRLILWSKNKSESHRAFTFDLLMSLAYADTIPNLQNNFKAYVGLPEPYNIHFGFINLCVPLYLSHNSWHYQKAAKPQSGAIGKLTSEIILRFIQLLFQNFKVVKSIGGVGIADAVLKHADGRIILCEIKASPLTTFPFLFSHPSTDSAQNPSTFTRTQVEGLDSALYMHCEELIPLGKPEDELWPFNAAACFVTDEANKKKLEMFVEVWEKIRKAYIDKDRNSPFYYIANASGHPPEIAKSEFNWPSNESISDSKTSAGMDRTDDIKKGIYQTFKLSVESNRKFAEQNIKTALISNLPAYRHGTDYIEPFYDVYWGYENSFNKETGGKYSCYKKDLKRPFDYIIALEDAFLRDDLI